jgi:hypothetical protein
MRSNGISNFPDPTQGPGGQGLSISMTPGSAALTVQGVTFSGPAFEKAEQSCRRYLVASGPPPQLSASGRAQLVAFAKCMRAHGVPRFADPTTGPVGVVAPKRSSAYSNSPAFNHAVSVCGGLRKR